MKWQEIASMTLSDLENVPFRDLRKMASQLNSVANKRIRSLDSRDLVSSASVKAEESGGKFTIRGKQSREDVLEEMARAKSFLRSKSSTVKGARHEMEVNAQTIEDITGEEPGIEFDWGLYHRALGHAMEYKDIVGSESIREKVIEIITDNPQASLDEINELIDEWANYETRARATRRRSFTRRARR